MTHTYPTSRSHITEKEFRLWRAAMRKKDPDVETWLTPGELRMQARLDLRKPTSEWSQAEIREHVAIAKRMEDRLGDLVRKLEAAVRKSTH